MDKWKNVESTPTPTAAPVLAIGHGKGKKRKAPSKNWKGKSHDGSSSSGSEAKTGSAPPSSDPKEATCFYCHDKGNWKRSCPKFLQDIKDGKINPTFTGIYTIMSNNSSHANS